MFSHDERIKAINLLLQYDLSYAAVIRELGYPSRGALKDWYKEYVENGNLHKDFIKESKFSDEERQKAVNYYLEHGKCVSRTVKVLGYPSRPILDKWIKEIMPDKKKHCLSGGSLIKYTQEQKEQAVISLCSRSKPAKEVAAEIGVTREVLYNWKRQLLSEGCEQRMPKKPKSLNDANNVETKGQQTDLTSEKELLKTQVDALKKDVYRLQLERDILETAAEVIKKDQGISLNTLTNQEKAIVINALRDRYQLKYLLQKLDMAKSSYSYQNIVLNKSDKYADVRKEIKEAFDNSLRRYGYRRIHSVIKSAGITVSEKVIRRIMK